MSPSIAVECYLIALECYPCRKVPLNYGESPPFQLPFYSEETLASARDLIRHALLPRVVGRDLEGPLPEAVDTAVREGVRCN